jgi:hypothetical protein
VRAGAEYIRIYIGVQGSGYVVGVRWYNFFVGNRRGVVANFAVWREIHIGSRCTYTANVSFAQSKNNAGDAHKE